MYHFIIFIVICLSLNNPLSAKLCLDAGKGDTPIEYIKVISERCSGSNYTMALLETNIENVKSIGKVRYGIEHFNPWFGYESSYYGPEEDYTFEGSENVLFVIIFRDPYDWLRSFKTSTFLGPEKLQTCDFSTFIRKKWRSVNTNYTRTKDWQKFHPLIDLNPSNGLPFKNVIKLRTAKIKNMLKIRQRVQNYYVINYENSRDYPQEVVKEVAELFNLHVKSEFKPILKIRGIEQARVYVPIDYPPISKKDLLHINKELDEKLENSIGYELKFDNH